MGYRCVATSVEGFVRQLAVSYITHGYWFYVAGEIPEGKDPAVVDAKLIERYGIAISKWARCRRKKQGLANMQYLRYGRFFVLLGTKGRHDFFEREGAAIRDVRRVPLKFAGYSVSCRKGRDGRWHASVRIAASEYAAIRAALDSAALWKGRVELEGELADLQRLRFAPVIGQIRDALITMNRRRRIAGLPPVTGAAVPPHWRIVRPFAREEYETTR